MLIKVKKKDEYASPQMQNEIVQVRSIHSAKDCLKYLVFTILYNYSR